MSTHISNINEIQIRNTTSHKEVHDHTQTTRDENCSGQSRDQKVLNHHDDEGQANQATIIQNIFSALTWNLGSNNNRITKARFEYCMKTYYHLFAPLDYIVLQEVGFKNVQDKLGPLKETHIYHSARIPTGKTCCAETFVVLEKKGLCKGTQMPLNEQSLQRFEILQKYRCQYVELSNVIFLNVHLSRKGRDGVKGLEIRKRELRGIFKTIKNICKDKHVVIAGDFNTYYQLVDEVDKIDFLYYDPDSNNTTTGKNCFDHFLYNKSLKLVGCAVIPVTDKIICNNHYPKIALFTTAKKVMKSYKENWTNLNSKLQRVSKPN
ncbi:hypothetical protein FDP41_000831 [Naegleria fowleri]|uniref:Endonuclease/exonuclease/phosphatase domain-containing protein n=1 Tax=Naegleria fowleri TaxID=5763 RepID=A0A6A5CCX5_NAEFO|nr:uncharacterized protein FDP41_000831 [Naegleria fowleri]KAF0984932.1 hypothetical protein FDP41_000831 [Naegleria fowleri]